jgi:metal-responsive CopG/Arc/MetJ family transcriptional regulator
MAMEQITFRLPKQTLAQFDRAAQSQGQARDTLLVQLVQEYVQRSTQRQEIGRATLAALGIKPRRKRTFNARKAATALKQTYGTSDGVEIVNLNRNRWTAHP